MIGAFIPYVIAAACQNHNFSTIWRVSLGIGAIFPAILLVARFFLKEPEEFLKHSMRNAKTPYLLILRFYGFRLLIVSLIWFLYDVSLLAPQDRHMSRADLPSSRHMRSEFTRQLSWPIFMTAPQHR